MLKRVAVLVVNPVNGSGLFQYLEAFFENGIYYRTFAVGDSVNVKTNSGISMVVDDVIANLKGHEEDFDALVFACGDAMPKFGENITKQYNQDMITVIKTFAAQDKIMIGHCAAALLYSIAGIGKGRRVAVHPLAKSLVDKCVATDSMYEVDGNYLTAQSENTIHTFMDQVIKVLK